MTQIYHLLDIMLLNHNLEEMDMEDKYGIRHSKEYLLKLLASNLFNLKCISIKKLDIKLRIGH
jgi:hypothetical protein